MQKLSQENVVAKYELSEDEIKEVSKKVYEDLIVGKPQKDSPIGILIAGQPGAGKTGLANYTYSLFQDAVVLDIDEFRFYHPKIYEILKLYPEFFAATTNKFISKVSGYVTDMLIEGRYDIIAHKTFKNILIIDDTIIPMKNAGYNVYVNAYAVNGIVSKLSAVERTQKERELYGYNRVISNQFHDDAYNNMTAIIKEAFDKNLIDSIQVFMRGKVEDQPNLICMIDKENGVDASEVLTSYYQKPINNLTEVINIGRIIDFENTHPSILKRLNIVKNKSVYADEKALISVLYDEFYTFCINYETPRNNTIKPNSKNIVNIDESPGFFGE